MNTNMQSEVKEKLKKGAYLTKNDQKAFICTADARSALNMNALIVKRYSDSDDSSQVRKIDFPEILIPAEFFHPWFIDADDSLYDPLTECGILVRNTRVDIQIITYGLFDDAVPSVFMATHAFYAKNQTHVKLSGILYTNSFVTEIYKKLSLQE